MWYQMNIYIGVRKTERKRQKIGGRDVQMSSATVLTPSAHTRLFIY